MLEPIPRTALATASVPWHEGGAKLGGLSGSKLVLAQRLATVLGWVCGAGCEEDSEAEGDDISQPGQKLPRRLVALARPIAEVPADAVVDAAQAESALGHLAATEFDEEWADVVDKDLRAEEEALFGRYVNPKGIDYSCLADADASGWHPPLVPRRLFRSDFHVTLQGSNSDSAIHTKSSCGRMSGRRCHRRRRRRLTHKWLAWTRRSIKCTTS